MVSIVTLSLCLYHLIRSKKEERPKDRIIFKGNWRSITKILLFKADQAGQHENASPITVDVLRLIRSDKSWLTGQWKQISVSDYSIYKIFRVSHVQWSLYSLDGVTCPRCLLNTTANST
jgi:hypothetical protein